MRTNLALRGLTTSNLERKFFHGKLQNPMHVRDSWSEAREDDAMKLTDLRPDEQEMVINKARYIWSSFYGIIRLSGKLRKPRWDLGKAAGV